MSISAINSTSNNYATQTQPAVQNNPSGSGAAASTQTPASSANDTLSLSSSSSSLALRSSSSASSVSTKIQQYANAGMSAAQIAQRLGLPVSTVTQDAAAAGIKLNGSSSSASTANTGSPAVGGNINVTV